MASQVGLLDLIVLHRLHWHATDRFQLRSHDLLRLQRQHAIMIVTAKALRARSRWQCNTVQ
eukprot:EC795398.1.p4 GENE.EC795398.1~~EC795398.1.p4  ORF type:complete len:61 (-),score=9.14 EC795398.1:76-258(-)